MFQIPAGMLNDTHIRSSVKMIGEAGTLANSGYAVALGCGQCIEMPLYQLCSRFQRVDLVDVDRGALEVVKTQCRHWQVDSGIWVCHNTDLTGLIPRLALAAQDITAKADEPLMCLTCLGELLMSTAPNFWHPPDGKMYNLVICSAVLTQLEATVRQCVENIFLHRFPDAKPALTHCEPWSRSIWSFGRHLEDAFINHIETISAPDAIIYLSDTVHVCWLAQSSPDTFVTEGSWLALRDSLLSDYLRPWNTIIAEDRWQWIRAVREGPYWGRLYEVQAIIYRPR